MDKDIHRNSIGAPIDDNVNIKGTSARNGNHITRGFTYEVSPVAASQHTSAT